MREDTESRTLWSQSMFDALVVALRRQQGDDRVRELIADLKDKGYTVDIIASKVVKALGPKAGARVHRLAGAAAAPSTPSAPRSRQPYRMSRSRRFQLWFRDAQENVEDALDALRRAIRRS